MVHLTTNEGASLNTKNHYCERVVVSDPKNSLSDDLLPDPTDDSIRDRVAPSSKLLELVD